MRFFDTNNMLIQVRENVQNVFLVLVVIVIYLYFHCLASSPLSRRPSPMLSS